MHIEQAQQQEPWATQASAGPNGKRSFWQRRPVVVVGTLGLFGLPLILLFNRVKRGPGGTVVH